MRQFVNIFFSLHKLLNFLSFFLTKVFVNLFLKFVKPLFLSVFAILLSEF